MRLAPATGSPHCFLPRSRSWAASIRTSEAGDAAGVRDQLAALLPIQEQVMGAMHPDTLAARDGLASGKVHEAAHDARWINTEFRGRRLHTLAPLVVVLLLRFGCFKGWLWLL